MKMEIKSEKNSAKSKIKLEVIIYLVVEQEPCCVCQIVKEDGKLDEQIISCDHCEQMYHPVCVGTLLTYISRDDWFCPTCM